MGLETTTEAFWSGGVTWDAQALPDCRAGRHRHSPLRRSAFEPALAASRGSGRIAKQRADSLDVGQERGILDEGEAGAALQGGPNQAVRDPLRLLGRDG
jgi:hypothetical protein